MVLRNTHMSFQFWNMKFTRFAELHRFVCPPFSRFGNAVIEMASVSFTWLHKLLGYISAASGFCSSKVTTPFSHAYQPPLPSS